MSYALLKEIQELQTRIVAKDEQLLKADALNETNKRLLATIQNTNKALHAQIQSMMDDVARYHYLRAPTGESVKRGLIWNHREAELDKEIDKRIKELAAVMEKKQRCSYCDDTGDVHRADGEWLGKCTCVCEQKETNYSTPANTSIVQASTGLDEHEITEIVMKHWPCTSKISLAACVLHALRAAKGKQA